MNNKIGQRKRNKSAGHEGADIKLMSDIPIALPAALGEKPVLESDFIKNLLLVAGIDRRTKLTGIKVALAKAPDKLVNIVLGALEASFQSNDEVRQTVTTKPFAQSDYVVACKKGCAWCCYQNVEVTIPEAILVAIEVGTPGDPRQQQILNTAADIEGLSDNERTGTGKACPFLVERACSVYERRPIPCRNFLAPDAENCRVGFESIVENRGPVDVKSHGIPQIYGRAFQAAVQGICKDLGLQYDLIDLVQSVAAILRDPAMIGAWASGKLAF